MTNEPRKISLDFVDYLFYENYAIGVVKENVIIDYDKYIQIQNLFLDIFENKPFAYISNRKYDYQLDASTFSKMSATPYLKGIAVLCYDADRYRKSIFEKSFFDIPFLPFYTMEECEGFVKNLLKEKKADL